MNLKQIEIVVKDAISRAFPGDKIGTVDLFYKWIREGLMPTQGEFILSYVGNAKFAFQDKDNANFTADVILQLAPDYKKTISRKYVWRLKGRTVTASLVEERNN